MRLAARVIALVAAACGSLAALGMPPASAAATTATTARATTATATVTIPRADPSGDRITLTAVSPAVLRPGDTLLVTGTIDVTSTAADGLPTTVRLVRGRSSLTSRSDVDEWSAATGAVSGTELGRQPLDPAAPRNAIPFQFTVPADQVRPGRAYGVIARQAGLRHEPINIAAGERVRDKVFHIQNVNAYDSRLKAWMRPFNGVATRYLQNYLGWRRMIEGLAKSINPTAILIKCAQRT